MVVQAADENFARTGIDPEHMQSFARLHPDGLITDPKRRAASGGRDEVALLLGVLELKASGRLRFDAHHGRAGHKAPFLGWGTATRDATNRRDAEECWMTGHAFCLYALARSFANMQSSPDGSATSAGKLSMQK